MGSLRVAVPNKGQLAEPARAMLIEAGYLHNAGLHDLVVHDPQNDVEFFFLRPKDVAIYVGEGTLDLGITGRDMLLDSAAEAVERVALGFAPSAFRLAAPRETATTVADLQGKRIATSYAGLLTTWLADKAIDATVCSSRRSGGECSRPGCCGLPSRMSSPRERPFDVPDWRSSGNRSSNPRRSWCPATQIRPTTLRACRPFFGACTESWSRVPTSWWITTSPMIVWTRHVW